MGPLLLALLVAFVICQVALFVTTIYLHRTLSHRAMTMAPSLTAVMRFLTWVTTGIRPRQWVAVHRKHHAYTDVEGDPHSPVLLGFTRVQVTNAALYRKVAKDGLAVRRYARDLPADRWDHLLFDHALVGLGIGVGFLCLVFGWKVGLVASAVHMVLYLALNAAINAVGHTFGSQPYENGARNNQWLALLTAGEGLHNNHHAAPTSAKLGLNRGEIDPAWWVVRLARGAGMVSIRHDEAHLKSERVAA